MKPSTGAQALAIWVAIAAAALSTGLYAARLMAELGYAEAPWLLDWAATIAAGGAAALLTVASCRLLRVWPRSSGRPAGASFLLPLLILPAALLRPFPDLFWTGAVGAVAIGGAVATVLCAQPKASSVALPVRTPLAALLGAAIAFVVYWRTLAPSVVAGDSAEFQTLGYTLGIAHPTGYPLYLLLAKAFTFLPAGGVAYRVNLLSAVFAALAVYLAVCAAYRMAGDRRAALVAGLTFAFGDVFWSQAVVAEVYALNAFLIALVLLFVVRELDVAHPVGQRDWGHLAVWLAFGLGLAHHRTAILLAPMLLVYLVLTRRRTLGGPARVLAAGALAVLPLLAYLYLPLRWPAAKGGELDWAQFQWHVLGSGYSFALRPEALFGEGGRYARLFDLLLAQLSLPGLIFGAAGLVVLLLRRPRIALPTLLSAVLFALFPVIYEVPDAAVFTIPTVLIVCLWLAVGLASALRGLDRIAPACSRLAGAGPLGFAAAALIPASLLVAGYAGHDRSADWSLDRWGRDALRQAVPPGAVVIADMLRLSALRYFYATEQPERHIEVLMPDTEAEAAKIIEGSLEGGRPVYLARYLPGLERKYRLSAPGPLVELTRGTPLSATVPVTKEVNVAPAVTLAGFEPGPASLAAGETWHITLYWRAEQPLSDSHFVHLRFVDGNGSVAYQAKPGVPVQGLYPTWAWPVGQLIADYREATLPIELAPGRYEVAIGLGGAFSPPRQWQSLGSIDVLPPAVRVETQPALAVFGDRLALIGYRWTPARPGGKGKLALRWQAIASPEVEPARLHAELLDSTGDSVATLLETLRPPASLDGRRSWTEFHELPLAPGISDGTYRLRIRLDSGRTALRPVRSGWPSRIGDAAVLEGLPINPPTGEALTNLENKAILVRRVLERDDLRPGEMLRLTLFWRAAAQMDLDYTVFVHLLDAAQRVRAQVDTYPAGGARPTSQWRPDELVVDPYQIPLPADLPAGEYQLEVGMYSAATMERLQVVDEEQQPVDDRTLVGTVYVRQD